MSSTNSSDRLKLLSYATFNYHIPIHDHSWRQHHRKQTETTVALASLALRVPRSSFRKTICKTNAWHLLCLELTFAHEALVLIPTHYGDFTDFFSRTLPQTMKLNLSVLSSDEGSLWDSYVRWCIPKHNTWKAFLVPTLWQAVLTFKI